ncbi:hypothetical protein DN101_14590 [Salmonella enterica subsp. enterica]|nr:hypothetical protein [Salmonella enterica subsp. enterica serovar Othmarschen]
MVSDYRSVIATGAGSFRGVPFLISETVSQRGGRRTVKREYPRRDTGGADDLGRRLRERSFSCVVLGDDYLEQKDALIEALDAEGPGELVHPLYGTLQAQIDSWESKEDLSQQGVCTFQVTFYPPMTTTAPVESRDTARASSAAADSAIAAASGDFSDFWDAADLSVHDMQAMIAGALQAVGAISETVSSTLSWVDGVQDILADCVALKNSLTDLINYPVELAGSFVALIDGIGNLTDTGAVTSAYQLLLSRLQFEPATSGANAVRIHADDDADADDGSVIFVAPVSEQARQNLLSLDTLIYETALVSAATAVTDSVTQAQAAVQERNSARVVTGLLPAAASGNDGEYSAFESSAVVEQVAQTIGDELDAQVLAASELGWGATSLSLLSFRLLWLADMRERAQQLPQAVTVTPASTETAFVTLYRQTGDSRGWETFTRRNDLVNPLFVPGGQSVEVLNDE